MKRNWLAISRIPQTEYHLRAGISLTTNPETLGGYAKGFPQYFTHGDDDGPLKVPLSALMEAAEEASRLENPDLPWVVEEDRNFTLTMGWRDHPELSLPIAYEWRDGVRVPDALREQLAGKKIKAGITLYFRGKMYVPVVIDFDGSPKIGEDFVAEGDSVDPDCSKLTDWGGYDVSDIFGMALVSAEFIDLNA